MDGQDVQSYTRKIGFLPETIVIYDFSQKLQDNTENF